MNQPIQKEEWACECGEKVTPNGEHLCKEEWEERFDEKYCRKSKNLENLGQPIDTWFFPEELTPFEVKSFIRIEIKKARDEGYKKGKEEELKDYDYNAYKHAQIEAIRDVERERSILADEIKRNDTRTFWQKLFKKKCFRITK